MLSRNQIKSLSIISLMVLSYMSNAQVIIKGKVSDGKGVLPGANITIENTGIGVSTNNNGEFEINNVPVGKQVVVISFIGYEPIKKTITGKKGSVIDLGILEMKSGTILNDIELKGKLEEGERKAIQKIIMAPHSVSVISSDGIKKLPDRNAAEALQRMPGVVMESDQGEGRYISFRGTPADWSSAMVNGNRLPVTGEEMEGRTMNFDILPTSFIEYIEYNQNLTPTIEGDAIGGSADFITKYVPEKKTFNLQMGVGWNFKADKPLWNGSLEFGNRSKNGKWGYIIGGSLYNRNWATDNFEVFYGQNSSQAIERLELRDYVGHRRSYGSNFKFDYKPSDKTTFFVQGFTGQLIDDETNHKTMYDWAAGVGQSIRLQNIHNIMKNRIYGGDFGAEHKLGKKSNLRWTLSHYDSKFNYGNAPFGNDDPRNGYFVVEFEKQVEYIDYLYLDEEGNRLSFDDRFQAFTRLRLLDIDSPYKGYGDAANNINPVYNNIVGAGRPSDTLFQFKSAWSETLIHTEKDPIVAALDWDYQWNKKTKISVGLKYRTKEGERKKGLETWNRSASYNQAIVYDEFYTEEIDNKDKYLNEIGGYYQDDVFEFLTQTAIDNFLINNDYRLDYFELNPVVNDLYEQFVGSNFTYTEDVTAGYIMGDFKPTTRLSINAGVRIENTDVSVVADTLTTVVGSDGLTDFIIEKTDMNKNYTSVLSMVNLKYMVNEKSTIRWAVTRSFRRPNFNELKPGAAEIHFTHFHVMNGNPDLKPTYAWNTDLAYQYFFGLEGMVSVGVFYKYVTNHIFTSYNTEELVPRFNVVSKTYQNAPYANVGGVEFIIDRKLSFLPSFWKNFRVQFNYAYTASAMKVDSRPELQDLPRQAKNVLNAQLSYETKKFEANVALNFRDSYLKEFSFFGVKDPETGEFVNLRTNNDYDTYQGKALGLDASISYHANNKLTIYAEANNLLNTPYIEYRGQIERPLKTEYYSIRALIGIKYALY